MWITAESQDGEFAYVAEEFEESDLEPHSGLMN